MLSTPRLPKRFIFSRCVMVAQELLVLLVRVRILTREKRKSTECGGRTPLGEIVGSNPTRRAMIELEKLPMEIGAFKREKPTSNTFANKGEAKGFTVNTQKQELVFGTWRPVGAILKRVKVTNNEEVVSSIKDTLKWWSQKINHKL